MVKVLVLRCPRCTARFEVPVTRTRRRETCPSCGITLPPAPDSWAARDDLDQLRPGTTEELVGGPRKNWKVAVFTLATLGIYAFVYNFAAFDELDRQHRRRHATGLYLAGLMTVMGFIALAVAPQLQDTSKDIGTQTGYLVTLGIGAVLSLFIVFAIAYFVREINALRGYRKARGLSNGVGILPILLLNLIPLVGWALACVLLNTSIRELWVHLYNDRGRRIPMF